MATRCLRSDGVRYKFAICYFFPNWIILRPLGKQFQTVPRARVSPVARLETGFISYLLQNKRSQGKQGDTFERHCGKLVHSLPQQNFI